VKSWKYLRNLYDLFIVVEVEMMRIIRKKIKCRMLSHQLLLERNQM
jgi:hypothetical protein